MEMIDGYKAFNEDMTNRYGMQFEEGKTYFISGKASFGLKGNGFHFCKNIEDTFRYVDPEKCKIAEVIGSGDIAYGSDDYYGYYDMYSSTVIKINRILTREEVIQRVLNSCELSINRFLTTGYHLTDEEIALFAAKANANNQIGSYIDYYKKGDKDAFSLKKKL